MLLMLIILNRVTGICWRHECSLDILPLHGRVTNNHAHLYSFLWAIKNHQSTQHASTVLTTKPPHCGSFNYSFYQINLNYRTPLKPLHPLKKCTFICCWCFQRIWYWCCGAVRGNLEQNKKIKQCNCCFEHVPKWKRKKDCLEVLPYYYVCAL